MDIGALKRFMKAVAGTLEDTANDLGMENVKLSISFITVKDDHKFYSIACSDRWGEDAAHYEPHWAFIEEKFNDDEWVDKAEFYNRKPDEEMAVEE